MHAQMRWTRWVPVVALLGILAGCGSAPPPVVADDWLPAMADDAPVAVLERSRMGFCGIDGGHGSPARGCFLAALEEGSGAELGVVAESGDRITIVRSMVSGYSVDAPFPPPPDHWVEIIWASPAVGLPRLWERQTCETVRAMQGNDELELVGCGPLEPID